MTRTARANYPRAVSKDRSEAKNGMDNSTKKHGAGPHNWGSLDHELELEAAGIADEERELEEEELEGPTARAVHSDRTRPAIDRSPSSMSEEELAQAREVRKKAAKGQDVDLAAIARSSAAVSTSPPNRTIPISTDADTTTMKSDERV